MAGGSGYIEIEFEVAGQSVERKLATFGREVKDLSHGWERVGEDVLADNMLNMIGQGRLYTKEDRLVFDRSTGKFRPSKNPRATDWAALAPATVRDRERQGYPGSEPILWRRGDLARSVSQRGAAGNIFRVRPDGVEVGTNDPLAAYHQFGTVNMPARPIVGLTRERQAGVVKRLNEELERQIRLAGLAS